MKKILLIVLCAIVLCGCASTNGAADLKEENPFAGNVKQIIRVTSPAVLFFTVLAKEIQQVLQDNCFDKE